MAGISSRAASSLENRFKYNTWERNQDLSIEIDESFYRLNDYQTGRFWQVDPKTENMELWSPYASNYDNPVRYNDPKGDEPDCCNGDPIVQIGLLARDFFDNGVVPAVAWINRNVNPVYGVANGIKILATGSNFDGQQQSSVSGVTEIGFSVLPGAALEKGVVKTAEQNIVQAGTEAIEKRVVENTAQTGKYKDIKNVGHHIYQEAAVKNLSGYKSAEAIAVKVEGSGFKKGTQHYAANQVQKMPGGGTLGKERVIAYKALRAMGFTVEQCKQMVRQADKYFESLGHNLNTPTRIPTNRR